MRITSIDVPQADRLESVVQVIMNVANGARSDLQIIHNIPDLNTARQGRYYRKAAELLGFIENHANNSTLTPKGERFMRNPSINNPEFIGSVLSLEVIQRLLPYLELFPNGLTRDDIEEYLRSIVARRIGPTMLPRRIMTILSWLRSLGVIESRNHRYYPTNAFTANLPVVQIENVEQPMLPKSGSLDEYEIVQERIRKARDAVAVFRNDAAHDRARVSHRNLVNITAQRIRDAGGIPKSNGFIDLAVNLTSDFIFEMKSTTESNVRTQVRKGISQLYEYRYLENMPHAKLVLVVERPLAATDSWMRDYLESDRKVFFVWDGERRLFGSDEAAQALPFLNLNA